VEETTTAAAAAAAARPATAQPFSQEWKVKHFSKQQIVQAAQTERQ